MANQILSRPDLYRTGSGPWTGAFGHPYHPPITTASAGPAATLCTSAATACPTAARCPRCFWLSLPPWRPRLPLCPPISRRLLPMPGCSL